MVPTPLSAAVLWQLEVTRGCEGTLQSTLSIPLQLLHLAVARAVLHYIKGDLCSWSEESGCVFHKGFVPIV